MQTTQYNSPHIHTRALFTMGASSSSLVSSLSHSLFLPLNSILQSQSPQTVQYSEELVSLTMDELVSNRGSKSTTAKKIAIKLAHDLQSDERICGLFRSEVDKVLSKEEFKMIGWKSMELQEAIVQASQVFVSGAINEQYGQGAEASATQQLTKTMDNMKFESLM